MGITKKMDSPHRPEVSSPVVLQRPNITHERTQVVSNSGRRALAPPFRSIYRESLGSVATSASMPTSASSSVLGTTNVAPLQSAIPSVGAGRTTRSRRRTTRTASGFTQARSAASTSTTVPPSTTVQTSTTRASRKRKASSSSSDRRRKIARTTGDKKKPPPGADLKKPPPQAGNSKKDEDKKPAPKCDCCICMEAVEPKDVAKIDGCDHRFCFGCIEKWSERENKCPLCKTRFNRIERIQKKYKKGCKNTKKVKQRDQRSDISSGVALEGLLQNLHRNSGSLARIIFGGLDLRPTVAISTSRSTSGIHARFTEDSDDSDDDSPMAAFMRALHGSSGARSIHMSTTLVRPISVTTTFSTTTRSFARNVHDSTAGNDADNPLEIDDDEVIEIE